MTPEQKAFEKEIRRLCGSRHLWQVFGDYCELAALTLANAVHKHEGREKRYLDVVGRYSADEARVFAKLLALTAEGLDPIGRDFLGELFMALELSSHWHGQFFTPSALCEVMARLLLDEDLDERIRDRGFVTVQEPAAGAGAMVIGVAAAMRSKGLSPQTQLHVTAIDKDPTAAHMAFIQLALLGIPAQVCIGDTLRMEIREAFYTPMHWLGLWDRKLERGYALGTPAAARALSEAVKASTPSPVTLPAEPPRAGQLALFEAA